MAAYTVRVEMHGASWDEYQTLHERMEAAGLSRTITGDDGRVFELPTAEYSISNGLDDGVLFAARVKALVNTVRAGSWVLATKSAGRFMNYG